VSRARGKGEKPRGQGRRTALGPAAPLSAAIRPPMNTTPPPPSAADPGSLPELTRSMELVHAFQAGQAEALHELFARYEARLRRILRIEMGAFLKRFVEVDDLLPDIYLAAQRELDGLELTSHASILKWLRAIARSKVRDQARYLKRARRDRRREVPLDDPSAPAEVVRIGARRQATPSEITVHAEFQELIDSCVERLDPPAYRQVILQRDYYEDDWETVRVKLRRDSLEAVQELYRRAHIKLRARMAKHLGDEHPDG